jgi:hypothetical protein
MKMRDRSLFWPFAMIATGIVWLMINMGMIPAENLWALTHAWPFLLIALGLGLILRSYWRLGGRLASLLIVIAAVLAIIFAPQLGWTTPQDWNLNLAEIGSDFNGGVPGSGVVIVENREVSHFSGVDIRYPAVVMIQTGMKDAVQIEADDNLLPQLTTNVQNGTLIFDNSVTSWQKRVDPSDRILVTITVTELSSLNFPSAGQVTLDGIKSPLLTLTASGAGSLVLQKADVTELKVKLSGAGSIDADGAGDFLDVSISGAGSFNGGDYKVASATATISGVGSATVWVTDNLTANISGVGSIHYFGTPTVQQHVSGLGNVNSYGSK